MRDILNIPILLTIKLLTMKKYLWTLLAIILLAGISCQEKIDLEKEKEAIMAVIENETNSFLARDFDQQSKSFLQDESIMGLGAGKHGYTYVIGWKDVGSGYKNYYKDKSTPETNKCQFTNYKIKVYKESAWAVYDEILRSSEGEFLRKNISIRFLEKMDGEWKIVYLSYVNTTSYKEVVAEGEEEPETEETE